jgi:hypothetical protein
MPAVTRYAPVDDTDLLSAKPDFAGLIYPVLTMLPPWNNTQSYKEVLGAKATEAQQIALSVERQVSTDTPPVFLCQAADDTVSPIANSTLMFGALQTAKQPAALHIFSAGGHGWGMGQTGQETAAWPGLFVTWANFG